MSMVKLVSRVYLGVLLLIACVLAVGLGGCGSSDGTGVSSSADSASGASTASGRSDCPITEEQTEEVTGESLSEVPGPPTSLSLCTFAVATEGGVDTSRPGLTVNPYPLPGQPNSLGALHDELVEMGGEGIVERPQWGAGSFYVIASYETVGSLVPIDVYVGKLHAHITLPTSRAAVAEKAAETAGRILAAQG